MDDTSPVSGVGVVGACDLARDRERGSTCEFRCDNRATSARGVPRFRSIRLTGLAHRVWNTGGGGG
jgi:hypothetical protein